MERTAAAAVLRAEGWLAHQAPAFQERLLAQAQLRAFPPGAYVFRAGDPPGGIFGVVAGGFGVLIGVGEAEPALATILRPGVWFGHGSVTMRRHRVLSFRASEPSWAMQVPLAALATLCEAVPEAARALAGINDFAMDIALRTVADLLLPQRDRRIAATLLRLCAGSAATPQSAGLRVSQAELAAMAVTSRAVVSRTLGGFARRGWIALGYQRIIVRDPAALEAFVGR